MAGSVVRRGDDFVNEVASAVVADTDEDGARHQVDEVASKVDELEQKVGEVSQFYSNKNRPSNVASSKASGGGAGSVAKEREKEKEKASALGKMKPLDVPRKDSGCTKRMQELMRQFGTILRQISQHKWAWPFLQPVDVKGLDLHDYFDIIKKPMDFETIRKKMEVRDGSGYKNVREIYSDVRLVFTNAMTYNDEKNDVHQMARTLLEKFEEKWLQLLPKVVEEETRQKEEEAKALVEMEMAQEAAIVKIAKETDSALSAVFLQLDELRETLLCKCRKMSTEEKRKLGAGLSQLSPEDLNRALDIIAQNNPSFQATAEEVDLDMDALSESTLWRLKFFVKKALEVQAKGSATKSQENSKRKKEICDALAKTAKKRSKKVEGK
ncbi:transcription factor GTE1-like [Wolffia australiana]